MQNGRVSAMRAAVAAALVACAAAAGWVAAAGVAHAEVAPADPIDVAMRQCLARRDRSSAAGQIQCTDDARQQWQGAVDAAYQQLQHGGATAAAKRGWQESQRRWLEWRRDDAHLLKAVFETTRGSTYAMAGADMQLQPVRDRALALREAVADSAAPDGARDPASRVLPCTQDAACEHALFDMNRYYDKLRGRMPARSVPTLVRAQRAWRAFLDSTSPVVGKDERVDLIGARIATMKRLSETVGNH
ncbi:lysozyme inhibitor LprI family protein [Burkholderia guangdongensis]|uniref:lysozyme inhibitor LprI family protein n=1 Tax=Burkholderia guangdongensis TaxID=1792500 RepID=UPI001FE36916|nr:lysozyme inhibitor LprI family protein [Burkholderia guangdongensis]